MAGNPSGGAGAPGTPGTKQMTVQGPAGDFYPAFAGGNRTVGQDRPAESTSMSQPTQLGLLSKFAPGVVQSALAQQAISQIFPQGFTGTLGENQVAYQNGRPVAMGMPRAENADGDWAIRATDGKPVFVTKRQLLESNGAYLPKPNGMRVVSDGQGGFQITTGGLDPVDLSNPTKTKLEDTILTGRDALARITSIENSFKPEYQQLGTRWSNTWAALKDKAGIKLDDETRSQLSDFSAYRRESAANLNQTIKDITGATVSEQEAPRLMLQIPNAGSGLLDGDSPTEFQAKMAGTKSAIRSAIARAEYARKNGLSKEQQFAIPLDTIPQMIDQKGNQYRDELKRANPMAPDSQINEMVKARLRQEFGL